MVVNAGHFFPQCIPCIKGKKYLCIGIVPLTPVYLSESFLDPALCLSLAALSLLTEAAAGGIGSCCSQSNSVSRERGWTMLSVSYGCRQRSSGGSLQFGPIGSGFLWGPTKKKRSKESLWDPRRGGLAALSAKPLVVMQLRNNVTYTKLYLGPRWREK